jgi:pullulanase
MSVDILKRKETHFILWRPRNTNPVPGLVIGQFRSGNPPGLVNVQVIDLVQSPASPDLWEKPAGECNLEEGEVYHYWFEVMDSDPYRNIHSPIRCTDPLSWTVDWRLLAPRLPDPYSEDDRDPAGVVMYQNGRLLSCDPGGETIDWNDDVNPNTLPPNNRLVIYELPTSWSRTGQAGGVEIGVGTFRDVIALIDRDAAPANFAGILALEQGRAHLEDLGVNALELLPPADSFVEREWGYATSNYFAPDYDLGFPEGNSSPTASLDLVELVKSCHKHGMRFFDDMVMAFATRYSYQNINYLDFHVQANSNDPEEYFIDASGNRRRRDGFGGDLFKYNFRISSYDPVSGSMKDMVPARQLMQAYLARWMVDFRIDGIRMDSIENIGNWDFVGEFKNHAREIWRSRWETENPDAAGADKRFLVVGEELAIPIALITQNRLDGLWNENFKRMVRSAILGQSDEKEPSFEWTVRKLIDCRLMGFQDCSQAINYITSHDVEGFRNERLFNFLVNNRVSVEREKRIKLAFACLLTSVGVPMILAGEEFADQHDLVIHDKKQVDPVNYDRLEDSWRMGIFEYVSRLVHFRTSYDALAVNDTDFIHVDFNEGKRVLVWQRGQKHTGSLVVVVANFSDWGTDTRNPNAEYVVHNWPPTPAGKRWRDVSQDRDIPPEWVGREPIYPWEAKVYALV